MQINCAWHPRVVDHVLVHMLDWLIIGAGVHGLHAAACLRRRGATLRMLDPHPRPLAEWDRRAEVLAMSHLRSPLDHDIDVEQLSLHHYAEAQPELAPGAFAGPCRAPSVALFRRHVEWIRSRLGLDSLLERGVAQTIELVEGGVRVESERGSLTARRLILAIGRSQTHVPAWAGALGGAALVGFSFYLDSRIRRASKGKPIEDGYPDYLIEIR